MTDFSTLKPETPEQLLEAVSWAVSEEKPLNLRGLNSKDAIGHSERAATNLDLSGISGITLYEPEELILSARAGTPLAEIEAALAEKNQMLAFEPPNYGALLSGSGDNKGTIGGLIASNLAGPRRVQAGAVRDHFLGFKAVSGRGEAFKSGGRVVKNVTGYDLCKLLCGSWGTLAAMHEVTVKVLPRPEKSRTVLVRGVALEDASRAMASALNSPNEVSAACWLPETAAALSQVDYVRQSGTSLVAIRVEGPAPSVAYRCDDLRNRLAGFGEIEELHSHNSNTFWTEIRDVSPFCQAGDDRVVWKISTAPSNGPSVIAALRELKGVDAFLDWGGGLIWLATDAPKTGADGLVRDAVSQFGGHATLIRGSTDLRAAIPVFEPQAPALAALSKRLKASFDPHGLFNPGRMVVGG